MSIKPRNDLVLVRLNVEEEKRSFIIADTVEKEDKAEGEVMAVGPQVEDLKVGDKILFGKFAGDDVERLEVKYKLIKSEDILAILD